MPGKVRPRESGVCRRGSLVRLFKAAGCLRRAVFCIAFGHHAGGFLFLRPVNRRAAPGFEPLQERVVDEVFHFEQGAFADGGLQLALPDGHHPPAHTFQGFLVACVPFLVPLDFLLPEFRVGTGYVPVGLVSVPEAAMDEDDAYLRITMSGVPGIPFTFLR